MTELALLLIPAILLPLLFNFSQVSLIIFKVINLVIVVIFALEYCLKLIVSKPHWRYAVNPWHLLDLVIIVLAALDFVPSLPFKGLRASPLLRLLRLARVFALTGRVVRRVTPSEVDAEVQAPAESTMGFSILTEKGYQRDATMEEARQAVADPAENWIDIHGLSAVDIGDLSRLLSVPAQVLESRLLQDNFPGIDFFDGYTIITLWDSTLKGRAKDELVPEVENPNVVVIYGRGYIATLSMRPPSFAGQLVSHQPSHPGEPFAIRIMYSLLKHKYDDYRSILAKLEKTVAGLEDTMVGTRPPKFLETTFRLKKTVQKQRYNIDHFVQVLDQLEKNRSRFQGTGEKINDLFIVLHGDARALEDRCRSILENATSLIELQLNKVSFDLNRVMKVLAVITCLALVPTIIGGLLGQNLKDQPYNITIHEIFFFVISLMLVGLYVFYRKGWLK